MSRYLDDVQPQLIALSGVEAQILADLDTANGGVAWWDHLDPARRIFIGDYLLSLLNSIEGNLTEAAMHRSKVIILWRRENAWYSGRVVRQRLGDEHWLKANEETENRRVEIDAHLGGFFRAIGSVMDNLAGLVIGVAGLKKDIVRASVLDLQLDKSAPKGVQADGVPGGNLQIACVDALKQAVEGGPPGWWPWVNAMRNTLVHRARRLAFSLPDNRRSSGFMRPLPQNPQQSDAESLARARRFPGNYLQEDAEDTLNGVMDVVLQVVRATASKAVDVWADRRSNPSLILQPAEQWPKLEDQPLAFHGCAPGSLPRLSNTNIFVMVSPDRGRRFQAAMLLDASRGQWPRWLRADG
ncbi:hypothetical protein AB0H37_24790 [Actinomadura sp. NPDC023710]|uniref:hypothetical protein n=1 Tax=Actinomadura sp. NPDC023710 TaxID=3158219 RepID=UPI0034082A3A